MLYFLDKRLAPANKRELCQGVDCCDFDFIRHDTDAGNGWERSNSV